MFFMSIPEFILGAHTLEFTVSRVIPYSRGRFIEQTRQLEVRYEIELSCTCHIRVKDLQGFMKFSEHFGVSANYD